MRKNDFDSAISERAGIASGEPMAPRATQFFSSIRVRAAEVTKGLIVSISRRSGTMSAAFKLPSASMRLSLNFSSAPGNAVISSCPLRFPPVREILFKASCRSRSFSWRRSGWSAPALSSLPICPRASLLIDNTNKIIYILLDIYFSWVRISFLMLVCSSSSLLLKYVRQVLLKPNQFSISFKILSL